MIPPLRAFCPDLILVSAGFDGGCKDFGNQKMDSRQRHHQGIDLTPQDFEWATRQLLRVANVCCPGRLVSVLEGGYGTLKETKDTQTGYALDRDNLAENVGAHLSALAGVTSHVD